MTTEENITTFNPSNLENPNNPNMVFKEIIKTEYPNGKLYYSIVYDQDGEEYCGYSSYSLKVISEFLREYFMVQSNLPKRVGTDTNVGTKTMTTKEIIENLKLMQSQVEWDYPMDYAAAIDEAIEAVYVRDEVQRLARETSDYFTLSRSTLLWILGRAKEKASALDLAFSKPSKTSAIPPREWTLSMTLNDDNLRPIADKIAEDIEKRERERRTKHYWIKARGEVKCPVCGHYDAYVDNYCRHCGAKMEGIRKE